MDASVRVHVVLGKRQLGAHDAFGGIGQLDIVKQELVNGTARLAALPELLDMSEDLGVVGCVAGHGWYGRGRCDAWKCEDQNDGAVENSDATRGGVGDTIQRPPCDQQAAAVKRPVRQCQRPGTPHSQSVAPDHASLQATTFSNIADPNVRLHTTTMSDPIAPPPSPPPSALDHEHDSLGDSTAVTPEAPKAEAGAPPFELKALTDRTLHFLATASNETLGACLAGLGAGTYLILGRVGLVLIGVVGGVVLHATWEGHHGDSKETQGKSADARKRELAVDIAQRVLDWRNDKTPDKGKSGDDGYDFNVQLYSGKTLDYSDFKPETAAALTELTDAVIRDYVKYVLRAVPRYCSNTTQVVVLTPTAFRRHFPELVPPDSDRLRAFHICTPLPKATSRQFP